MPNYHKITKWPIHVPNGSKIFQIAIKYSNIFLRGPPKYTHFLYENVPSGKPGLQVCAQEIDTMNIADTDTDKNH
jgi:hypothetical protein